jgi:hypothetical protein
MSTPQWAETGMSFPRSAMVADPLAEEPAREHAGQGEEHQKRNDATHAVIIRQIGRSPPNARFGSSVILTRSG